MAYEQLSITNEGAICVKRIVPIPVFNSFKVVFDCEAYLSAEEKLILLALERMADDDYYDGKNVINILSKLCNLSTAAIKKTVSMLKQKGLLELEDNDFNIEPIEDILGLVVVYE